MGTKHMVVISEGSERADDFMAVLGRLDVPVESPLPVMVDLHGFDEPQRAYMLDMTQLTAVEFRTLVDRLAAKFGADPDMVAFQLRTRGLPILATECTLVSNTPYWLD